MAACFVTPYYAMGIDKSNIASRCAPQVSHQRPSLCTWPYREITKHGAFVNIRRHETYSYTLNMKCGALPKHWHKWLSVVITIIHAQSVIEPYPIAAATVQPYIYVSLMTSKTQNVWDLACFTKGLNSQKKFCQCSESISDQVWGIILNVLSRQYDKKCKKLVTMMVIP